MSSAPSTDLPIHYRRTLRTLVRFACVMTIVGLLSGVLFQESSKKVPDMHARQVQATLSLALLHGHVLVSGVILPIACGAALLIARKVGGRELGSKPLAWLTRGYLPFLCVSLTLMLWKGYHVLLSVRFLKEGEVLDLDAIDERFFFGVTALRHGVYGVAHVGMALSLGVFAVALFRSLGARAE